MIPRGMAQRIIHLFEEIEIDMHQPERMPVPGQFSQCQIQRAAVPQPCQRIGQRLFLGRNLGPLQAQVQVPQFSHNRRLCLGQIKHFDGQIRGRKIGLRQPVAAHRLGHANAKRQVDHQPAALQRHGESAKRDGGIGPESQMQPCARHGLYGRQISPAAWPFQIEQVTTLLPDQGVVRQKLGQCGAKGGDAPCGIQTKEKRHQPRQCRYTKSEGLCLCHDLDRSLCQIKPPARRKALIQQLHRHLLCLFGLPAMIKQGQRAIIIGHRP